MKLKQKQSNIPDAGAGLFAGTMFRKGDTVCEYAGTKMDKVETMDMYLDDQDTYLTDIHPYSRDLDESTVIIGDRSMPRSGVFVNDGASLKFKTPTAIKQYISASKAKQNVHTNIIDGKIYYVASKRIKKGEEIYAHYGPYYWLLLNGIPAEQLMGVYPGEKRTSRPGKEMTRQNGDTPLGHG